MKLKSAFVILFGFAVFAANPAQANLLISYNGNSLALFEDDGRLIRVFATDLVSPVGVATDGSGNVYVADDLGIRMYKIATGNLVRTVVESAEYNAGGLAFNPNNPGEIIHIADSGDAASELTRWDTSTTNEAVAVSGQGAGYGKGLYYTPEIRGVTNAGIIATGGGVAQGFNPTTLVYVGDARSGLGTAGGVTGTSSELYYVSSSGGYVQNQTAASKAFSLLVGAAVLALTANRRRKYGG